MGHLLATFGDSGCYKWALWPGITAVLGDLCLISAILGSDWPATRAIWATFDTPRWICEKQLFYTLLHLFAERSRPGGLPPSHATLRRGPGPEGELFRPPVKVISERRSEKKVFSGHILETGSILKNRTRVVERFYPEIPEFPGFRSRFW